jgi:hypothetical protein
VTNGGLRQGWQTPNNWVKDEENYFIIFIRDGQLKVTRVSIFRKLKSRGPKNTKQKYYSKY